jgi:serpin B
MPQWEYKSKFGLGAILSALGMADAFIPGVANISGIDGAQNLFVQSVVHEAFIKVNEAGTEAAAATGIGVAAPSIQPIPTPVRLDRPFIYLIRDIPTQTVLFVGRVVDPVQ